MTTQDLMYKMAVRAKELANDPINKLRYSVGTLPTWNGAISESKHKNKGELIEEILIEEFESIAIEIDEKEFAQ